MAKLISTGLVALVISSAVLPTFVAPAFAQQKLTHGKAKVGGGGFHGGGGGHGGGFGGLGGKGGAGVAAGIIGLAVGAIALDAIAHANSPRGCHEENQPLFDAYGNQVSSHRVRVCN